MALERIPVADAAGWRRRTSPLRGRPAHGYDYNRALAHYYGDSLLLLSDAGSGTVLPAVERTFGSTRHLCTPYGFSGLAGPGASTVDTARWQSELRNMGYVTAYIQQHPLQAVAQGEAGAAVHLLDLQRDDDALLAAMKSDARARLKALLRSDFQVQVNTRQVQRFFLENYPAFAVRLGAAPVYRFNDAALDALTRAPTVDCLGVVVEETVVAASLFLRAQEYCEYFLSAWSEAGRAYSRLVIWSAMRRYREAGCRWLNLGGGIQEGDSLDAFKARWGGAAVRVSVLRWALQPDVHARLCRSASGQGARSGYFPAYLSPQSSRAA